MMTVTLNPIQTPLGNREFQAVLGQCRATGRTAGQALDALTEQFPEIASAPILAVNRMPASNPESTEQQPNGDQ